MFKNALISVSNKEGLIEFVKPLAASGTRILSTGGTAQHMRDHSIEVVDVSEQTGFPEVMGGRVKTLHPNVHMCLLARTYEDGDLETLAKHDLQPIDLVVVNLYQFEKALADNPSDRQICEKIDIGGPSMLRAAAKSYERIAVVSDPSDYNWIAEKGELTLDDRKLLAAKTFSHVSAYDAMIAEKLDPELKPFQSLGGELMQVLRYGENPAQKGCWYRQSGASNGLHKAEILHGKALSYNNILDLDAAVSTLRDFSGEKCCVSLKHNNPCGVAVGNDSSQVTQESLAADPVSVFGGIVAVNYTVDKDSAEHLSKIFLECVVAPDFSAEALEVLTKKKNLRLLKWADLNGDLPNKNYRTIAGGFLVQSTDQVELQWQDSWQVFGEAPSEEMKKTLMLSWKVCAHLKSNAIALASGLKTVGLGMGQVNRVDAVEQAVHRAKNFHPDNTDLVLASDAFFPFADSIEKAAEAGIRWVIQPGGSVRDEEVISKAKELGVNMVFTGKRHFLH